MYGGQEPDARGDLTPVLVLADAPGRRHVGGGALPEDRVQSPEEHGVAGRPRLRPAPRRHGVLCGVERLVDEGGQEPVVVVLEVLEADGVDVADAPAVGAVGEQEPDGTFQARPLGHVGRHGGADVRLHAPRPHRELLDDAAVVVGVGPDVREVHEPGGERKAVKRVQRRVRRRPAQVHGHDLGGRHHLVERLAPMGGQRPHHVALEQCRQGRRVGSPHQLQHGQGGPEVQPDAPVPRHGAGGKGQGLAAERDRPGRRALGPVEHGVAQRRDVVCHVDRPRRSRRRPGGQRTERGVQPGPDRSPAPEVVERWVVQEPAGQELGRRRVGQGRDQTEQPVRLRRVQVALEPADAPRVRVGRTEPVPLVGLLRPGRGRHEQHGEQRRPPDGRPAASGGAGRTVPAPERHAGDAAGRRREVAEMHGTR